MGQLTYCVTVGWICTIWSDASKSFGQYESQQSCCLNCGNCFFNKVIYLQFQSIARADLVHFQQYQEQIELFSGTHFQGLVKTLQWSSVKNKYLHIF